jgi:hypothetical protein
MDLQKVIGKNLKAAERLVFQIETDVSRNQNNLIDAKQRVEELIKEGTLLSEKLAAAKEYLQDLEESKTD